MKLFTIGDSISQGFMSLSAARTDLSYSTLIAEKLGLNLTSDYRFADWNKEGIPLNVESIMRRLYRRYGADISGLEWLTVLQTVNDFVDDSEEYYERGEGAPDKPYRDKKGNTPKFFHNVAVRGFEVADAWQVSARLCREIVDDNQWWFFNNGYLTGADKPMYRTAIKVLNPSLDKKYKDYTQIKWLEKHVADEGVENLMLWLGANNALGTVVGLNIRQTPNDPALRPHTIAHRSRAEDKDKKWNLWHPDDFKEAYKELLRRVDAVMQQNAAHQIDWKVFVGTVPLVTIVPLAKGVGDEICVEGKGVYYKNYVYFPFDEEYGIKNREYLKRQDALLIDDTIRDYNETIKRLVEEYNTNHGTKRYFVVDFCDALERMAYKRNNRKPRYEFPRFIKFKYPQVNTKYYEINADGQLSGGGLFSLDGVHPSAIGQGLIAYEFLKVMETAKVKTVKDAVVDTELDWRKIYDNDRLYTEPIPLMHEVYGKERIADLAHHITRLIQLFSR